ncbi:hypothetical protein EZS27_021456 [termite gut metagenome]|uniref:Uncharacterized protein n=1 Tax=termite gut metagenome TaxID=433724 RepID=A0A5J4R9J7_9ZZZZ
METEIVNKIRERNFSTDSKIGYKYRESFAVEAVRAAREMLSRLKQGQTELDILYYFEHAPCEYNVSVYRVILSQVIEITKSHKIESDKCLSDILNRKIN